MVLVPEKEKEPEWRNRDLEIKNKGMGLFKRRSKKTQVGQIFMITFCCCLTNMYIKERIIRKMLGIDQIIRIVHAEIVIGNTNNYILSTAS